jgi:hypothetical protein
VWVESLDLYYSGILDVNFILFYFFWGKKQRKFEGWWFLLSLRVGGEFWSWRMIEAGFCLWLLFCEVVDFGYG